MGRLVSGWSPAGLDVWGGRPVARRCADAVPRRRAVLRGRVTGLAGRRLAGGIALHAVLDDGTGQVLLRWLGRDVVAGVTEGAIVLVEGTVSSYRGQPALLNPVVAAGGQLIDALPVHERLPATADQRAAEGGPGAPGPISSGAGAGGPGSVGTASVSW